MCVGVEQAFLHNPLRERMRQNRLVEINKKKKKEKKPQTPEEGRRGH